MTVLTPALALAQPAPADTPETPAVSPVGAGLPASPEPGTSTADRPSPKGRALAITLEVLAPLGGPGCFYRHRYVAGALVVAGSLLGSSMMLYALHRGDRDGTLVGAVTYGAMRAIGIFSAARTYPSPSPPSSFQDPVQRVGALPAIPARTLGFSYRFSF